MSDHKITLLEGDIAQHLRRLSIPLGFGMLSMTVFSVVDTYFISQLGTKYLAAFGFTLPMIMLFLGVCFGLGVGTSSVLSRVYGEGNIEKLKQMSTDALTLTALITTVAAIIGFFMIDPVFRLMGATDDILPYIDRFMSIWYMGLPFFGIMMVGNSCMRATGDTRYPSGIMILCSLITIVLDPFLIFGWGPFPEMRLQGAALALLISYATTCLISMRFLMFRKAVLSPVLNHPDRLAHWKRILHIALPSIFSNQIAPISAAIITWMAAQYGKEAVAGLGVATRIEGMCILVFYALGAGVSIFSGQNFGAGNFGRVQEACRIGAWYSLIWGVLIAALVWPFAHDIPVFFDADALVSGYAAQYLHWVPISFGAMGAMVVVNAAQNAMGKPLAATGLILLRTFVLYVPLAYVLQKHMGFSGIVIALTATNMIVGVVAVAMNRRI